MVSGRDGAAGLECRPPVGTAPRDRAAHGAATRLVLIGLVALHIGCGGGTDGSPVPPPTTPEPAPPPPPPEDLIVPPAEAGKVAGDRIRLTLTSAAGAPLPDTAYKWTTDEHSGWLFPAEGRTDEEGAIDAAWIPGFPGVGELTLEFAEGEEEKTLEFQTFSVAPPRPPNSAINAAFSTPLATGYAIDMTPLTEPLRTYYAAINWDGGYAGLQRRGSRFDRQLQFSVWDRPEGPAVVVEEGPGVECTDFGGEGTGAKCETEHPWAVGETFRFVVTEEVELGASVISLTVTDLETGERRFIGTLKYARKANMTRFGVFVEDFDRSRPTCLDQPVRSAAFRRARWPAPRPDGFRCRRSGWNRTGKTRQQSGVLRPVRTSMPGRIRPASRSSWAARTCGTPMRARAAHRPGIGSANSGDGAAGLERRLQPARGPRGPQERVGL